MLLRALGFNATFYEVGATVLLVLFLALLLEGGGVARSAIAGAKLQLREFRRARDRATRAAAEASRTHRTVVVIAIPRAYGALTLPAVACIALFDLGEVSSVLALNARHASGFEHGSVLAALLALPLVLVAVTAISIITTGSREIAAPKEPATAEDPVTAEDPGAG